MYIFRKSEALKKYKWDMMSIREERDVLLSIIIDHSKKERIWKGWEKIAENNIIGDSF